MRSLLVICAGAIACGVYVLLWHPNAALLGLALIAIPGVIVLQAVLIAIAIFVRPPSACRPDTPATHQGFTELAGILHAYRSLKLFLARVVGFVAVAYGIVALNAYYLTLGVVAVVLFWIWDRIIAADQPTRETTDGESDANNAESFGSGPTSCDAGIVAQLSDGHRE